MKKTILAPVLTCLLTPLLHAEAPLVDFNYQIRPILSDRCFLCHGFDSKHREADLRLDTPEGAFEKRKSGQPIVPGDAEKSLIWQRIISDDPEKVMPTPESHLTLNETEKSLIKTWIEQGAHYEKHWSFVLPKRPQLPEVKATDWIKNPIDNFVLARLEKEGLKPSPQADDDTLARRRSLDLTGLPAEGSDVDTLLSSPHFGERWALPWLDAGRYSDSNGFQGDPDRFAYPWRDYIIKSLNSNKRQNELIIELLAGDMLDQPTEEQLIATAFNRNHLINNEGGAIKEEVIFNYVVDRVDATATTFLGLTFACAQCHDHKYDPISHEDYFRFFAFFSNMDEEGAPRQKRRGLYHHYRVSKPVIELNVPAKAPYLEARAHFDDARKRFNASRKAISAAEKSWITNLSQKEVDQLESKLAKIIDIRRRGQKLNRSQNDTIQKYFLTQVSDNADWRTAFSDMKEKEQKVNSLKEDVPLVMVMKDKKTPPRARVRDRGVYDAPIGEKLSASLPTAFSTLPKDQDLNRSDLAAWIVSKNNPLTARVLMNRLWQEIFGLGIVSTPEDFGFQGALPTHPKLLDWLAVEFIESGWDFKHMVKLITTSATYEQSSKANSFLLQKDPENKLLARGARFRLPSSILRDQALAVSGLLTEKYLGPPTYPKQPDGMWKEVSFGKFSYPKLPDPINQHSRSLYSFWRRTMAPPNMFDAANRQVCSVKPARTNTPLQALTLLNDPIYLEAALTLAKSSLEAEDPVADLIKKCTQREITSREAAILQKTFTRETQHYQERSAETKALTQTENPRLASLTIIAQIALNLDEVLNKQ